MKYSFFEKISTKILLSIVGTLLILGILMLLVTYLVAADQIETEIKNDGRSLASILSIMGRYAVASGNVGDLREVCNEVLKTNKDVASIVVEDDASQPLVTLKSESPPSSSYVFKRDVINSAIQIGDYDFHLDEAVGQRNQKRPEKIGNVTVVLSSAIFYARMNDRLRGLIRYILLAVFASIGFGIIIVLYLNSGFSTLSSMLVDIKNGNYSINNHPKKKGEIGDMQSTIVSMAETINKNTFILEETVRNKTHALEEALSQLTQAADQKRKLTLWANSELEAERKRIASEIHDDFNGAYIAIKLHAQHIKEISNYLGSYSEEINNASSAILYAANEGYSSARRLVKNLRPDILDTQGFFLAVKELVRQYDALDKNVVFNLTITDSFTVSDLSAVTGYRVIQECLANAVKHSGATLVAVLLDGHRTSEDFTITISDNGKGIALSDRGSSGFGLLSMRDRVETIGGRFEIRGAHPSGTILVFTLPRDDGPT